MTEKEKLKEIIETALGFHDYYKVVVTEKDIDRLTDKLIENGYGNVTELKVELRSKVDYIHELWEVKEDYKHRAEVAERNDKIKDRILREFAVQVSCKTCPFRLRCNIEKPPQSDNDYKVCRNNYIQQAEREIAEDRKNV